MTNRDDIAAEIAKLSSDAGRTVAAAESLTGGMVSSALAAAEGASQWFRGGVVAYSSEVKFSVLDVPEGPVVTAEAAGAMAGNVRELLGADVAVATTGAGGPDPQDGQEPGTVFVAVADAGGTHVREHSFSGEPGEVCGTAAEAALEFLLGHLRATRAGG